MWIGLSIASLLGRQNPDLLTTLFQIQQASVQKPWYLYHMATLVTKSAFHSPIGPMTLQATDEALISAKFVSTLPDGANTGPTGHPVLDMAKEQLGEYFSKERMYFDLPLQPNGTEFQMKVWEKLGKIYYGRMTSYSDIALSMGNLETTRAVGAANSRNPLAVIIPCHRVIAKDGKLTGYAWGLQRKKWLLELESPMKQLSLF
jgi:methylated-DNA-[protein]-cysteine S-methyltransferase